MREERDGILVWDDFYKAGKDFNKGSRESESKNKPIIAELKTTALILLILILETKEP